MTYFSRNLSLFDGGISFKETVWILFTPGLYSVDVDCYTVMDKLLDS